MKEKRVLSFALFSLLAMFLTLGLVSAATTLTKPIASAVVGGNNVAFNVTTTDNVNPGSNLLNLTFYAQSASTANSSWVKLLTLNNLNTTASNNTETYLNLSYSILEDSNDYIFNVTLANATNGVVIASATRTGVTVDTSIPQAATSVTPSSNSIQTNDTLSFSATVVGVNTTSCKIIFPGNNPGSSSYAGSNPGNSCTASISGVAPESYTFFVRTSDGTNTTDSGNQIVTINIPSDNKAAKTAYLLESGNAKMLNGKLTAVKPFSIGGDILGIPVYVILILVGVIVLLSYIKK